MAYSKLYSSIVHSSLWTQPDHVRILFITLLAIADREGFVYGSRNGLLRLANVDLDQCDECEPFTLLMAPDKDSSDLLRNPENEGRRLEEVPGGFRILNFLYYRGLRNEDDRREQNRLAQIAYRKRHKQSKPTSAKVSQHKPISEAEAETEAEAEEEAKTKTRVHVSNWLTEDDLWIELQQILPETEIQNHIGLWIARIKENRPALYEAICDFKLKRNQSNIRNIPAWLTQRYQYFKDLSEQRKATEESEKLRKLLSA